MDGTSATMALPRLVEFLAAENPGLMITELEAVRHLPVLKEGALFSVRRHIRAAAVGRNVVIKVLKRAVSPGSASPPTEREFARLLKEIKILSSPPVLLHENLVDLESMAFGVHCGDPFEICPAIVLESAPHGSLETFQEAGKTISWSTRKALCYDIASGLDCLHGHGVLHGDLNRSHVLIFDHPQRNYMAKLTGFGDSAILSELEHPFTLNGTRIFRAPEIDENSTRLDGILKTDVFSLGLLLWSVFVNKDFLSSFDLPINPDVHDDNVKDILGQPYLFRFIPLIIEDEVGRLEDIEFRLLQDLFACTVRISPRCRDLKRVLELLGTHSRRKESEPPNSFETEGRKLTKMRPTFDKVKVSVGSLQKLPFQVAQQYLKALESILDLPEPEASTELRTSALWTLFLCYLHGYGTEQNSANATQILASRLSGGKALSDIAQFLVPVLQEALNIEPQRHEGKETSAASIEREPPGNLGPWFDRENRPPPDPNEHGLDIDKAAVLEILASLEAGEASFEKDCGSSNTLLHASTLFGLLDKVHYLIEKEKLNLDATNSRGETALFLACRWGHESIVGYLLDCGADASIETNEGENGLHWLCAFPVASVGKIAADLVRNGANLVGSPQDLGRFEWIPATPDIEFVRDGKMTGSPLMRAVGNRDAASLKVMVFLHSLYLDAFDMDIRLQVLVELVFARPLRLACELHLYDIIALLCDEFRKAIVGLPESCVPLPFRDSMKQMEGDPLYLGLFFAEYTNSTTLLRGAIDNSFQIHRYCYHKAEWKSACERTLAVLIHNGFLNKTVYTERGPVELLAYTIECGNEAALDFFLELPPLREKINHADEAGFTLIHHALNGRQFGALKALAENGATVDLRKQKDPRHCLSGVGASYLHVLGSLRSDDAALINFILDHGVPATINDNRGLSALNLALKRGAFGLARILIAQGASILTEGIYGLTPLGELFVPGQANQHDDLFSTFKFLLSYQEQGIEVFITRRELQYTVLHTAAAYYSKDELYPKLVDTLLQYYGESKFLEAQASTQAQSTALQIAIAMYNPVVVKALAAAGAKLTDKDTSGRTPLDYAQELLLKLVHRIDPSKGDEKVDKLERIATIIMILAEKTGWPEGYESFPELSCALDDADVLLEKMMRSEHQVAYMRHLEREVFETVQAGYDKMLEKLGLDGLDLIRRVVMRRVAPTLRMDIEYRVMPRMGFISPSESFEAVRERIPWCTSMQDSRLQEFQQAAAFEWFLDQVLKGSIPEDNLLLSPKCVKEFASSGKAADLQLDPELVRFPLTLLKWYEKVIIEDGATFSEEDREQVKNFVTILRSREMARSQGQFPLPQFGKVFEDVHFDNLQPEKLAVSNAAAAALLVTRCRCYFDRIGKLSRFHVMRMCQRMTSLDDKTWENRLAQARISEAAYVDELSKWKKGMGIFDRHSSPVSVLDVILLAEKVDDIPSLLAHPEDMKDPEEVTPQNSPQYMRLNVAPIVQACSAYPYKQLDFDKLEIRLLRLLPPQAVSGGRVQCSMDHFSVSADCYTESYREYTKSVDPKSARPFEYRKRWLDAHGTSRFVWGDFSCLSYAWGDPHDSKVILVNGLEVTIRANLEAALRSLSMQSKFRDGLLLWADALCINQEDTSEKERVVRDMQNIYQAAHSVTVWLGAGDHESDNALHTIRDFIATYTRAPEDSDDPLEISLLQCPPFYYTTTIYPAIVQLMDRSYWRRLWIMQEITACAPCENVYIGNSKISWKDLVVILRYAMDSREASIATDEFTESLLNRVFRNIRHAFGLITMASTYRRMKGLGKLNTAIEYGNWASWIYLGSTSEVTDERDRVYGLLGLLPDRISSKVHPNYSITEEEVYRNFSRTLVEATGSFDDIFRGTISDNQTHASWSIEMRGTSNPRVVNGKADGFSSPYAALLRSGQMTRLRVRKKPDTDGPYKDEPHYRFSDDGTILTVLAVHIDTVQGASGGAVSWTAPITVLNVPWKQPGQDLQLREGATARETLLQVLYANPECKDEPNSTLLDIPFYNSLEPAPTMVEEFNSNGWSDVLRSEMFRIFHKFRIRKGDFNLFDGKKFRDFFPTTVGPCNREAILESLSDVKKVSECTFVTTERGHLGSTGVAATEGDRVCVIFGCSYPVLVRPDGDNFRIIGECYLDGFMNGEALEMVGNGDCSVEEIQLH